MSSTNLQVVSLLNKYNSVFFANDDDIGRAARGTKLSYINYGSSFAKQQLRCLYHMRKEMDEQIMSHEFFPVLPMAIPYKICRHEPFYTYCLGQSTKAVFCHRRVTLTILAVQHFDPWLFGCTNIRRHTTRT